MIFVAKLREALAGQVLFPIAQQNTPKEHEGKMCYFSPSGTNYLKPCVGVGCI